MGMYIKDKNKSEDDFYAIKKIKIIENFDFNSAKELLNFENLYKLNCDLTSNTMTSGMRMISKI